MMRGKAGVAVVAALLLFGGVAVDVQAGSLAFARRGADDAEEGGHRDGHHGGATAAPATDAKTGKGKALFEQKCGVCHELSRALNQTKTRDGWTSTVKRMQQSNGCPITDAEAADVIDYLTSVRGKK